MGCRLEFLKIVIVAVLLLCTPAAASAWSVRLIAGEGTNADVMSALEKEATALGHTVASPLGQEALRQIRMDALTNKDIDPESRLKGVDLILFVGKADKGASVEVVSVSRAEVVNAGLVLPGDTGDQSLAALLDKVHIALAAVSVAAATDRGAWVETTARGYGKSGMPDRVVHTVALADARRNAVQKLLGATVNLKEVGDARKIESSVTGSLKSTETGSGSDATGPWVEISASVWVPQELLDQAPAEPKLPAESGLKPLQIKSAAGTIDWDRGLIIANGKSSQVGPGGRQAAIVDAQANALKLARSMAVDADRKVKDAAADAAVAIALSGSVKGGEVTSLKAEGGTTTLQLEVPLHGVKGLQTALIAPVVPIAFDAPAEPEEEGGVIIDMRGQGATAALFPKIVDEQGEVQFDPAKDMDPQARQERGFAAYAVADESGWLPPAGWDVIEGALIGPDTIQLASLFTTASDGDPMWLVEVVRKAPAQRAARRRQGGHPARLQARSSGRLPANIVFSTQQQDKKTFYARLSKSLKKGRVVILTDTAIGGVEGRQHIPSTSVIALVEALSR